MDRQFVEKKDGRGVELSVGDLIVYPSRSGSSLWMVEAIVTALYFDGIQVERQREYPRGYGTMRKRKVKLTNLGHVTKINDERKVSLDDVTQWIKNTMGKVV